MAKDLTGPVKTAWDAFAQWVRVSGCIETTGYPFAGVCVTCDKQFHITYLDAGHCFAGKGNARLFHEELVNNQCRMCNRFRDGRAKKYRKRMDKKYGVEQVDIWKAEGNKPISNKDMDYEAIKLKYREKLHILLVPFGYNDYKEMLHGHQF